MVVIFWLHFNIYFEVVEESGISQMVINLESFMELKLVDVAHLDVCKEAYLPATWEFVVSQILMRRVLRKDRFVTNMVEKDLIVSYYDVQNMDKLIKFYKNFMLFGEDWS